MISDVQHVFNAPFKDLKKTFKVFDIENYYYFIQHEVVKEIYSKIKFKIFTENF